MLTEIQFYSHLLPELMGKLNPHFQKIVNDSRELKGATLSPKWLLNERFDIMAKYIYAWFRDRDINSNWGSDLYSEHIRVFNGFYEVDTGKSGREAFFSAFHDTLDSVKNSGFDQEKSVIPIDSDFVAIDGGHRLAACLLYDRNVSTVIIDNHKAKYNYEFFLKRGLERKYCDCMALEYCKIQPNTYLIVVWPSASVQYGPIKDILCNAGEIVYERSIPWNTKGAINIVHQVYQNEQWLGNWQSGFRGVIEKAELCFRSKLAMHTFLMKSDDFDRILCAKKDIRKLMNIGNHSVHTTDTQMETLRLAQSFFCDNSMQFLNSMSIRDFQQFNQLLEVYENWIVDKGYDKENFCVVASSVLSAYGIREGRDIDFIHKENSVIGDAPKRIDSHNSEFLKFPTTSIDDIIFNPDNHFYYKGLKFQSIDMLRKFKEKRREAKDVHDIALINQFFCGIPETLQRLSETHYNVVKGNQGPKVTVLMPIYNGQQYLRESIESILDQEFADFEYLIINDGSTDSSVAIIESYTDPRIRLVHNEQNVGLVGTLNRGINLSRGQYIARMDCDDISLPKRLQLQVQFMEQHQQVGVCGSWYRLLDGAENLRDCRLPIGSNEIKCQLLFRCPLAHPSVILRKSTLLQYGLYYDYEYKHAEDYNLWMTASKFTQLANIPEFLLVYRRHGDQVTSKHRIDQLAKTAAIQMMQLARLGVHPTGQDALLHTEYLANCKFVKQRPFVEHTAKWLLQLKAGNEQTGCYSRLEFINLLDGIWQQVCFSCQHLGPWVNEYYIKLKERLFLPASSE